MAKEKKTRGKLPWHSAFYAGIQIELEEEADKLNTGIKRRMPRYSD